MYRQKAAQEAAELATATNQRGRRLSDLKRIIRHGSSLCKTVARLQEDFEQSTGKWAFVVQQIRIWKAAGLPTKYVPKQAKVETLTMFAKLTLAVELFEAGTIRLEIDATSSMPKTDNDRPMDTSTDEDWRLLPAIGSCKRGRGGWSRRQLRKQRQRGRLRRRTGRNKRRMRRRRRLSGRGNKQQQRRRRKTGEDRRQKKKKEKKQKTKKRGRTRTRRQRRRRRKKKNESGG
jgi:hypothetical protein